MSARIDPDLGALYDALPRMDLRDMSAIRKAETARTTTAPSARDLDTEELPLNLDVGDRVVPTVLYRFTGARPSAIVVHIHGGGFIAGSAYDPHTRRWCLQTARRTGAAVLAVNYRLAPEHPFPAGHDDCHAAIVWTRNHRADLGADSDAPIILHGQSAGGALAAGVALRLRDDGQDLLAGLLLDAPVADDRLVSESMLASHGGPVWTIDEAAASWRFYLKGDDESVPAYAAPARATTYAGLPRTFISVNAVDALRDEALTLAQRMVTDGVDVDLRMYARTLHGSALVGIDVPAGEAINKDQYAAIRAAIIERQGVETR